MMEKDTPMAHLPASPVKLPFLSKLIYGMGDWGNSTTSTIFMFFFAFFLTDIGRLDPIYAAPIFLVGGIWDAINDPLIGILVDRVHTRWGRRRPFFIVSALPLAITFMFLFWVPPWQNQIYKALYYGLMYILFDTAYTFLIIPYSALTPELTEDYDERTRLNGYRMVFSMAGGLICAISVPIIVGLFPHKEKGYFIMAVIFGCLAALPYILIFFRIRERFGDLKPSQMNLRKSFIHTFRNKPFRYAAAIYMTAWMTVGLVSALMIYYLTYYLNMASSLEIVLGILQAAALLCIPVMVWMSGKLGKQNAYLVGIALLVIVLVLLSFLPQNPTRIVFFLAALAGLGVAAAHVVPWSIVPDTIDVDELATGQRREGVYYGFLAFFQKTGTAVILALVQLILHVTGYVAGGQQSVATLNALRWMIGPLPAILLAVSMLLAWRYPLNRVRYKLLHQELNEARIRRNLA
jgi:glycoside/pentoside/hexuronide:cation symporter, GPH family